MCLRTPCVCAHLVFHLRLFACAYMCVVSYQVAYNAKDTVALEQVYMTQEGLASAEAAINALCSRGQTNIWDGLHSGLKV